MTPIDRTDIDRALTKHAPRSVAPVQQSEQLMAAARDMEAAFLAEMLKHCGLEKAFAGDTGLAGEAFSSLLLRTLADKMADTGGFGLANKIYGQLKEGKHDENRGKTPTDPPTA